MQLVKAEMPIPKQGAIPTSESRRAGCVTHKSGSVRAGGGKLPLATRPRRTIVRPANRKDVKGSRMPEVKRVSNFHAKAQFFNRPIMQFKPIDVRAAVMPCNQ